MDVAIGNVPQGSYAFSKPIVVTVTYSGANMVNVADEAALNLLYWDGDSWEPAILTCPEAVRRYRHDLDLNRVDATVCHLSEFSLMGDFTYKTHLTIGLRTR